MHTVFQLNGLHSSDVCFTVNWSVWQAVPLVIRES